MATAGSNMLPPMPLAAAIRTNFVSFVALLAATQDGSGMIGPLIARSPASQNLPPCDAVH